MKKLIPLALLSLAAAGLAFAADAPPTEVIQFEHAKLDAIFAKGGSILANSKYKLLAGRRVEAGSVEVHALDTDVFYVVEGSATFVTGGTVTEPKNTEANEVRGKAIVGGVPHHLSQGDVIIVPKGVPHWFTEVNGPFLYFVVKVTE
ncbi:MAG TPA: cupin domain-containing protein [Lacunisphaera sp.]|jgi:mannose-6-phosphate isomerase-like protein (cupin superfamily)|nr:cupin domain-containing protein [Lacunisphaera sp.]